MHRFPRKTMPYLPRQGLLIYLHSSTCLLPARPQERRVGLRRCCSLRVYTRGLLASTRCRDADPPNGGGPAKWATRRREVSTCPVYDGSLKNQLILSPALACSTWFPNGLAWHTLPDNRSVFSLHSKFSHLNLTKLDLVALLVDIIAGHPGTRANDGTVKLPKAALCFHSDHVFFWGRIQMATRVAPSALFKAAVWLTLVSALIKCLDSSPSSLEVYDDLGASAVLSAVEAS